MQRDDGCAAVAIEMDVWGFGENEKSALEDLMDNVRMQVSFAIQKEDMTLLERPADSEYFEMFNECRDAYLHHTKVPGRFVRSIPLPNDMGSAHYATA